MPEFKERQELADYLKRVLCGPRDGETEEVEGTPFLRYMTGMLFPLGEGMGEAQGEVNATADEDARGVDGEEESSVGAGAGMELAFETLPAAVGLSFRIDDNATLVCKVRAAQYSPVLSDAEKKGRKGRAAQKWVRTPIPGPRKSETVSIKKGAEAISVLNGLAKLAVRWRSADDGMAIVTVSLVNQQRSAGRGLDPGKTLFQVGLRCEAGPGILPYPAISSAHESGSEDAEVAYLYRHSSPYARGHGSAATWGGEEGGRCKWVATEFIPAVDVPYATFELGQGDVDKKCLDLGFLDTAPRAVVIRAFTSLHDSYAAWVGLQRKAAADSPEKIGERFVARAEKWVGRIKKGIQLLKGDDTAWHAFRLANRAMGMQMVLSENAKQGPFPISDRRRAPALDFADRRWRPFQVAFFLAVIESLANDDSNEKEAVDVIWFPTGGGKTEAYLFVAAFELVRRRLVHGSRDTATAVLSRYTMRLLTTQQFQRTGALMVAMELLRREDVGHLGARQFTLGLWVGRSSTPNQFKAAYEAFSNQLESNQPKNPFLLLSCPCCATEIFPRNPVKVGDKWKESEFGIISTQVRFNFRCPNGECQFHDLLPLNIVDDALYADPPSMLVGTIDKFAMLPWDERARVFFRGLDDKSFPTSLIIQDELHLISGPLGSLAAPYEAAIDTIIKLRGGRSKRIASTATIRNASEQVRGLYGREAAVFPTPCGKWDEAFFFGTDKDRPGRTYLGAMGQGYIKPVVAMAWTAAALLQSVKEVPLAAATLDAYWTLLVYHNSRRELGRTLTAARDEVATRIKAIASHPTKARAVGEALELSAHMVKSMSAALGELERKNANGHPAVDLVPCTSIISVGVDVDRLGVMLVNGQPKLTSEYIQATSRIGRGGVPGLVVTLFSPSKPRDRSHYEDFRAYHESIYRHVEPTSVTPYALPARERTLHAALVALVRHALEWKGNDQAGQVDFDAKPVAEAVKALLTVMCASDPTEAQELVKFAEQKIADWREWARNKASLYYEHRFMGAHFPALLSVFGDARAGALWETMMSLRNVDAEAPVAVK